MEYKLTSKYQHAKVLSNGKRRSVRLYFLNDICIFEQKVPFDETSEFGYPKWHYKNEFLLNGRIHQTRWDKHWIGELDNYELTTRDVSYPISKKILEQFNIPKDFKIDLTL
jgi:hypothetical protein